MKSFEVGTNKRYLKEVIRFIEKPENESPIKDEIINLAKN